LYSVAKEQLEDYLMHSRYTAALAGLTAAAAIAVPAAAQARSASDDPPNHERLHQVEHARRPDRVDIDRSKHRAGRDDVRHHDGRGSDDGSDRA
jgi:hypothetical protein